MKQVQPSRVIPGLIGLRGLAACAVFGVHYNQLIGLDGEWGPFSLSRLLANGEYGVPLFFILSGFLLSMPFWQALQLGQDLPRYRPFLWRRLARILPAYYMALTLLVITGGLWRWEAGLWDIALHYLLLHNLAEFSILSINPPFWTLAIETQFYLMLPLLFLLLPRLSTRTRVIMLLALSGLAYGGHYATATHLTRYLAWPFEASLVWIRPFGATINYSLLAHLPLFITGTLLSRLYLLVLSRPNLCMGKQFWRAGWLFWLALILLIVVLATELEAWLQIPYGRYGFPLMTVLLCILIITAPLENSARRCLDTVPMRICGTLSYGIYIYHYPVLLALYQWMGEQGIDPASQPGLFAVAGAIATLLIAAMSWWMIEKPVVAWVSRRQAEVKQD